MIPDLKTINPVVFQNNLIEWFKKNKRDLPWRKMTQWYPVFLSEFLLQQTQVEQALPYYDKFIQRFPDIDSLSRASEQEVLTLWAGLGYYNRARNLLKTAKIIVTAFNKEFPYDIKEALSLPGIGKYTASAILSIAFNKPYAVVDGNVYRVITRLFAISDDIRLSTTQNKIQAICDELLSLEDPGNFNEAMMELGATLCRKQNPDCLKCPLQIFCKASTENNQSLYPYKSPAKAKRKVFYYAYIFERKNRYLMVKRPNSGLLASFWEFPVIERVKFNPKEKPEILLKDKYKINGNLILTGKEFRHQYSHIDLTYKPVMFKMKSNTVIEFENYIVHSWLSLQEISELPVHNAHLKLINWLKNLNR